MSTGLVLLASEQLWPNIQSLAHLRERLARVCIYYTAAERQSLYPAQRLHDACSTGWRRSSVSRRCRRRLS